MKRNIVIATLTATALAGGTVVAFAAGDDDVGGTGPDGCERAVRLRPGRRHRPTTDDDDRTTRSDDRTAVRGSGITAAEAIAAALRHTPGTAVSAELDDDGADAGTWNVDVVRGDGAEYGVDVSGHRQGAEGPA